ncbi:MAG: 50S ribosomal protein L32 [Candidatus Margulisbacteria bacterium]|nr:50S ribosomal protein L32 [Candidatus Margulisiibacteriota bacterium]
MAVPKKRRSKSRKRTHRSLWKIAMPTMATCKNCGVLHIAHRACTACGYYNGVPVLQIKQKADKKEG